MIVLPRKPSYAMQQLEALVRRLPEQDSDYIYYNEQLHKVRTGFIGEQKVDQMWNEIKLSTEYRMIHNLEFRSLINSFGGHSHIVIISNRSHRVVFQVLFLGSFFINVINSPGNLTLTGVHNSAITPFMNAENSKRLLLQTRLLFKLLHSMAVKN